MKIGIAGAGLVGRLLAFRLARAGHAVEVFDPAADAQARGAAGWTAAGMLCPVAELQCADEHVFALGLRSLELWPEIAAQLDVDLEVRREGSLLFAHRGDEGAAARTIDFLTRKAPPGFEPQPMTMAQARELEPAVQGPAHAWLLPGEGSLHTVQAMQALAAAATRAGARWHWGRSVERLERGALWSRGERHAFDWVFDARGAGARPELPVRGVRGEVFTLHAPGVALRRPLRLLHPRHAVYLVPRGGDQVVVGASSIESEDRSPVSLRTTVELLAAAHSLVPELGEARIVLADTNLRPALPDNLPRVEAQPGITRLNGLYRHGWLIAPAMVEQALEALA
ncbi:glycine oxidase ThiO [Ramlibacter solisilvae]|uniref:Thiamine biosynthesis protein thio n=1 Tax=Ramlibacter tataouinensis TaxID=94132 RepID=A0A127JTB3_9BURK|nr:glycine oxidase ThiO [Ramlibacter tataouinensis]AMO23196.1 thiamine biosynthesis protein thio [Ramlibacter tataouinensis]